MRALFDTRSERRCRMPEMPMLRVLRALPLRRYFAIARRRATIIYYHYRLSVRRRQEASALPYGAAVAAAFEYAAMIFYRAFDYAVATARRQRRARRASRHRDGFTVLPLIRA